METKREQKDVACKLCGGTKCLTQSGIVKIYLLPRKFPLILIVAGIAGGVFYSKYIFILAAFGLIAPLAMADFRLYLYPVTAIAHCFGKKLNCPKCEPHCSVFRKS